MLDIRMVRGTEIVEVHKFQAVALNFISKYISYLDILNVYLRDISGYHAYINQKFYVDRGWASAFSTSPQPPHPSDPDIHLSLVTIAVDSGNQVHDRHWSFQNTEEASEDLLGCRT